MAGAFILTLLLWQPGVALHLGPKDTFTAARLSDFEIKQITSETEASAFDTPESWREELRVRRVHLGDAAGLVVQGSKFLCGATGNCQTWIFRKKGDQWKSLFTGYEPPIVEGFRLGPTITNGIPDLTVWSNTSAETSRKATYKFDGNKYRPIE